jgi:hypothetical protein
VDYIDIRDYEADIMYKSIVEHNQRNINLILTYKTKLNKFIIYRQDFKTISNDYTLTELQNIDIVKQKTGFGYKKFFRCPYCGQRRQNLYYLESELKFACRSCISINVFRYRCNLYDGKVSNVISYKVAKIMRDLKADNSYSMYDLLEKIPYKPKYMRWEKYALSVKRLHFLYWMWEQYMTAKYGPAVGIYPQLDELSVRDINDMLQEDNTNFSYEHFLFPKYYRTAYEICKKNKDEGVDL